MIKCKILNLKTNESFYSLKEITALTKNQFINFDIILSKCFNSALRDAKCNPIP